MLKLKEHQAASSHEYGARLSQKLTDLAHESHLRKVTVHNKHEEPVMQFPLLFGIVITLLLPIFVGIALAWLFITEGNLFVEKES